MRTNYYRSFIKKGLIFNHIHSFFDGYRCKKYQQQQQITLLQWWWEKSVWKSIISVSAFTFYAVNVKVDVKTVAQENSKAQIVQSIDWACVCAYVCTVHGRQSRYIKIPFNNIYEFVRITSASVLVLWHHTRVKRHLRVSGWMDGWAGLIKIFICHFVLLKCNLHMKIRQTFITLTICCER